MTTKITELFTSSPEGPGVGLSVRTYPNGYSEMYIFDAKSMPKGGAKRKAAFRNEQDDDTINSAIRRSKRIIKEKCLTLSANRMITLTTAKDVTNVNEYWHMFKMWLKRLRRANIHFQYVAVAELHKSGQVHIHIATNKFLPIQKLNKHWNKITGLDEPNAVDMRWPGKKKKVKKNGKIIYKKQKNKSWKPHKLASYISKYISKETIAMFGQHRYRTSLNIHPEKQVFYTAYGLHITHYKQFFEAITSNQCLSNESYEYHSYWLASWDIST